MKTYSNVRVLLGVLFFDKFFREKGDMGFRYDVIVKFKPGLIGI